MLSSLFPGFPPFPHLFPSHFWHGFPPFPGELMFGASIFQSPDSSLAAATVVLLPVLLVAFSIYSQSSAPAPAGAQPLPW